MTDSLLIMDIGSVNRIPLDGLTPELEDVIGKPLDGLIPGSEIVNGMPLDGFIPDSDDEF